MADMVPQAGCPSIHHVYPTTGRPHVMMGTSCWCEPHLYRLCTQCDDDDPACWMCEGCGIVRIDEVLPGDRAIVVHHTIADDEPIRFIEAT